MVSTFKHDLNLFKSSLMLNGDGYAAINTLSGGIRVDMSWLLSCKVYLDFGL